MTEPRPPEVTVHTVPRGSIVVVSGVDPDGWSLLQRAIADAVGHTEFVIVADQTRGGTALTVVNPESVPAFLTTNTFSPPIEMPGSIEVVAHVHLYPPTHNAGAELMLHAILKRLRDVHGFRVRVITNRLPRRRDEHDGIPVQCIRDARGQQSAYTGADVVITHLDATAQAMGNVRRTGHPLVHLVHNHAQLDFHHVPERFAQLVVFNSEWIRDGAGWPGRSTVVVPPVWTTDYAVEEDGPHDAVTLINCSEAKGGNLFWALAARFPDVRFLGVAGSYGEQVAPPPGLANAELWTNQRDVRKVYAETRVLLMPSAYESWGRVAVEAGCSGIPTIASATPGLIECGVPWVNLPINAEQRRTAGGFERAATVPDNHTLTTWGNALARLLNEPSDYETASAHARKKAFELETVSERQVDLLAAELRSLVR